MLPYDTPLITSSGRLVEWRESDEDFYLGAATWTVRQYCGWHIAPSKEETGARRWFRKPGYWPTAGDGLIMLRSIYVTAVDQVTIDGKTLTADTDYFWDAPNAWIQLRPMTWPRKDFALIDFTHGYNACPPDMEVVIYEMVERAMELPASNATNFQTLQYGMQLNNAIGITLTDEQKTRISRYRLTNFGTAPA
jgi:hypothetical protein